MVDPAVEAGGRLAVGGIYILHLRPSGGWVDPVAVPPDQFQPLIVRGLTSIRHDGLSDQLVHRSLQ